MSTSSYRSTRNRLLMETLMNSKFYKDKKNFVLKEVDIMDVGDYSAVQSQYKYGGPEIPSQWEALEKDPGLFLDIINISLDVVGVLDPTGIADLSNMMLYAIRGKYIDAFFSFVGAALPYLGDSLKILKTTAKLPLDLITNIFEGFIKYMPKVEKLLAWCKTKPVLSKVVWLVEQTLNRGPKWLSNAIDPRSIRELTEDIITPKIIESRLSLTMSWDAQKAIFKSRPVTRGLEIMFAGISIPANLKAIYMENIRDISTQLILLQNDIFEDLKKKGYTQGMVPISTDEGYVAIPINTFIISLEIYYVIKLSDDPEMQAYIFNSLGEPFNNLNEIKTYLSLAQRFKFINSQQVDLIIKNMQELKNPSFLSRALTKIGETISKIIPKWIEQAQSRKNLAKSQTNYVKEQALQKAISFQSQGGKLAVSKIDEPSIRDKEKQEYEKIRKEQEASGTLPVGLPSDI